MRLIWGQLVGLALVMGALTLGCGAKGPEHLKFQVKVAADANNNAPIPLAILVVYDQDLLKELGQLSAREWFDQMDQRKRDNPDSLAFDLLSWELEPGASFEERVALKGDSAEGVVFADYLKQEDKDGKKLSHRTRFNPGRRVLIVLNRDGFRIVDLGEEGE